VREGAVAWGDYDSDGDLDLLLSGRVDTGDGVSEVYTNESGGVFAKDEAISWALTDVASSAAAWGDYDTDGDLDLVLTGYDGVGGSSVVYENTGGFTPNAPPAAPTSLTASSLTGTTATLAWDAPTDDTTPASGLNYTLRIGSTPGGQDVLAPMSLVGGTTDGQRLLAAHAPVQQTTWQVEGLAPVTTYYWSVQAVDHAFAGSVFAAEGGFTTVGPATRYVATTGSDTGNACLLEASPCATLSHALVQANVGDTIFLAAGIYTETTRLLNKVVRLQGPGALLR
jgi:hypothetical protein